MYSEDVYAVRKELYLKDLEIAEIEKNHHLEGKEKEAALQRLAILKNERDEIRSRLSHTLYEDISKQNRGGRRWK